MYLCREYTLRPRPKYILLGYMDPQGECSFVLLRVQGTLYSFAAAAGALCCLFAEGALLRVRRAQNKPAHGDKAHTTKEQKVAGFRRRF